MSQEAEQTVSIYIRKYAEKHGITFEEAKEHAICELASIYLKEEK